MKGFWLVFVVAMLAVRAGGSAAERASVVADGAHLLRVASGFSFTEGPGVLVTPYSIRPAVDDGVRCMLSKTW